MNISKFKNLFYLVTTLITVGILVTSCQKESILTETEISNDVIDLKVDDAALQNVLEGNDVELSDREDNKCHFSDFTALSEIFRSTNGDNWTNNTGWSMANGIYNSLPEDCDFGELYGVTVDANGRVKTLNLADNNLTGITGSMHGLVYLTDLNLSNNNLSGSLSKYIGNLKYLKSLNLKNNEFSGKLPAQIGNIGSSTTLNYIDLSNNNLSGCIEGNLQNFCRANFVNLDGNNFNASFSDFCNSGSGVCPVANKCIINGNISDWHALRSLYKANNGANWTNNTGWSHVSDPTGDNPAPDCDLSELYGVIVHPNGQVKYLDLYDNNLSGTLTQQIRGLIQMVRLNLSFNNLSGNLQKDLGELKYMEHLDLCNNQLTGSIPGKIGDLENLNYINLKKNNLSGCFDENLENLCDVDVKVINTGNNFDSSFTDFCNTGAGVCP